MDTAPNTPDSLLAAAAGGLAAFGVTAALVPLRNTLGPANVALLLTVVVVVSAIFGGRTAGALSGVVGALTFNFLYARPYLTLRVNSSQDIATIALIVVIGVSVGQLTTVQARRNSARVMELGALHSIETVAAVASAGGGADRLWAVIHDELVGPFGLAGATWERGEPAHDRPTMDRRGHVPTTHHRHTGAGFALPAGGIQVPVVAGDRRVGQIVLDADPATAVPLAARQAILAMADQLAAAISATGSSASPRAEALPTP